MTEHKSISGGGDRCRPRGWSEAGWESRRKIRGGAGGGVPESRAGDPGSHRVGTDEFWLRFELGKPL